MNNWRDGQQPEVVTAGLAPADDRESALYQALAPGAYTAIVAGTGGAQVWFGGSISYPVTQEAASRRAVIRDLDPSWK